MNKLITLYQKAKIVTKFVWRHFFTIVTACLMFSVWLENPIILKNAIITFVITFFLDWAKMRIKLSNNCYSVADVHQDYRRREACYQKNNPCVLYSPTYNLNHLGQRY
jgi:hypothetical protein